MKHFLQAPSRNIHAFSPGLVRMTTLMAVLLLLAIGCDSNSMEEDTDTLPPTVQNAQIEVSLQEIQVINDCDSGNNPGDFQFQIAFVDEGNTSLADPLNLPQGTTFGTYTGQASELLPASDNNRINLGQTISFQRPREDGSGFGLIFSGYEWDAVNNSDSDMTNRSVSRTHAFQNGSFTNIIGTKEMSLGNSRCRAMLRYAVTVR